MVAYVGWAQPKNVGWAQPKMHKEYDDELNNKFVFFVVYSTSTSSSTPLSSSLSFMSKSIIFGMAF